MLVLSCNHTVTETYFELESPDGRLNLACFLDADSAFHYSLSHENKILIDTSGLGFRFENHDLLVEGWEVIGTEKSQHEEDWEMPWGEQRLVENEWNQLVVNLKSGNRQFDLEFRLFNDGLGFRYHFPHQENWQEAVVEEELTEFVLKGNPTTWWIPGDWDSYEHLYQTTSLSEIDALEMAKHPSLINSTIPLNAVNTPVTMRTKEGLHLSLHEAALLDFPGMTLELQKDGKTLKSALVGNSRGLPTAKIKFPFSTPWRTVQVARSAAELYDSRMILNLNAPNRLGDVSWIKPTKYVGIWWEMHLAKSSWDLATGKHGATTSHAKELIDFAHQHGIGAMLVEGWNTGWERWIGFPDREGVFDFVTPYPDYDLEEVLRYGKEKGVELIMHHETSAAVRTYAAQMDTAYGLMNRLGIHTVKSGYVGPIIPEGEHHHGQWMVNQYQMALEKAGEYEVAVNAHEPIKPTGLRRTYPNAISREGVRGQEFNAWAADGGNPPEHLTIVPFTRGLAGPIDFTPGIFQLNLEPYKENKIQTTLAHQLALYVIIYSPIQMVPDLIENYEGHPAFQFIEEVAVDWEQSQTLNAEIGDYIVVARQERGGQRWFLGGISDENARELVVQSDFLEKGKIYDVKMYRDGARAFSGMDLADCEIKSMTLTGGEPFGLKLAAGGGTAMTIVPQ